MSAVWIALGAVGISLISAFIALNAAQAKKRMERGNGVTSDSGGDTADCGSDSGCGGDGGGD